MEYPLRNLDDFACVDFTFLDFVSPLWKEYPLDPRATSVLEQALGRLRCSTFMQVELIRTGTTDCHRPRFVVCIVHHRQNFEPYGKDYSPHANIQRIAEILNPLLPYLANKPKTVHAVVPMGVDKSQWPGAERRCLNLDIFRLDVRYEGMTQRTMRRTDNDISWTQTFREALGRPPGTHKTYQSCSRGGVYCDVSPIEYLLTQRSLQSFFQEAVVGDMVEHVYILYWLSEEARIKLREENKDWWHNAFEICFRMAEKEGKISDVEHWSLKLEQWPSTANRCSVLLLLTGVRWLIWKLSFRNWYTKGDCETH